MTKLKNKFIFLLIALAMFGALFVLTYENSSSAQETNNILQRVSDQIPDIVTYSNTRFGFKFNYPKAYDDKGCGVREENNTFRLGNRIHVSILDAQGRSLDQYVNEIVSAPNFPKSFERSTEPVADKQTVSISYQTEGMGRHGEMVFISYNSKIFRFSFLAGPSCVPDILELDTFGQILSTLTFTTVPG